ncbi:MAG: IS5/IS1182 family transposase, partial [Nostoc sp.]
DSSPLWGAARVEDTYNLLGHALRKALSIIAESNQDSLENVASNFSAHIIAKTSLKAALDLDWDNPEARNIALSNILQTLNSVESQINQKTDLNDSTVQ